MRPELGQEAYLGHILDAIVQIRAYTRDGKDTFFASRMIQDAVVRNLEIIGEATKNLTLETKSKEIDIPWKQIAGMRDVLIHAYFGVNLQNVWDVVQNRLPGLEAAVSRLIAETRPS